MRFLYCGLFKEMIEKNIEKEPSKYDEKINYELEAMYKKRDHFIKRMKDAEKIFKDMENKQQTTPQTWIREYNELKYQFRLFTIKIDSLWDKLK